MANQAFITHSSHSKTHDAEPISLQIDLKEKMGKLNKTLYNSKIHPDKIEKLEKDLIRDNCLEKPEAKPAGKTKPAPDYLTLILKSEHKTTAQGTKILKLPKLPFGKHNSYNEEQLFKDRHFLEEENLNNTQRIKELDEITRKFRLHEKRYKSKQRNCVNSKRAMLSDFAFYDVYDMGTGNLVCGKEEQVAVSYVKDKERYIYEKISLESYKKEEGELTERLKKHKKLNFKQQQMLLDRLNSNVEAQDSSLSRFYSTKYSSLFAAAEKNNRKPKFRKASVS